VIEPVGSGASALAEGALSIGGGTVQLVDNVTLGSGAAISNVILTSLAIAGNGTLDIGNNHIIIDYAGEADPIGSVIGWIKSGYSGGTWTGTGVTSTDASENAGSYGIGFADAADAGNPAGLSSGTIEIAYALLGDANLSGVVDGIDFGIVAANFNKGVTGWDQGDFNYDGVVDGSDFGDLAANFNKGAAGAAEVEALDQFAAAHGLLADVPEPTNFVLLCLVGFGCVARRRRRMLIVA
jgi:hypothetical protein